MHERDVSESIQDQPVTPAQSSSVIEHAPAGDAAKGNITANDGSRVRESQICDALKRTRPFIRMEWLKHTLAVVVGAFCIHEAIKQFSDIIDDEIQFTSWEVFWNGIKMFHWFYFFALAFIVANALRYLLASFAGDLLLSESASGAPNQSAPDTNNKQFIGSTYDTVGNIVILALLALAASSLRNKEWFCVAIAMTVFADLFLVIPQLILATRSWAPSGSANGKIFSNWLFIDCAELAAWIVLFYAHVSPARGYLVVVGCTAVMFLFGFDLFVNRLFWLGLCKYDTSLYHQADHVGTGIPGHETPGN